MRMLLRIPRLMLLVLVVLVGVPLAFRFLPDGVVVVGLVLLVLVRLARRQDGAPVRR